MGGTPVNAGGSAESPIMPTIRYARFGAIPLSIRVVITSCAPVRALRNPAMNA